MSTDLDDQKDNMNWVHDVQDSVHPLVELLQSYIIGKGDFTQIG